MKRAWLDQSDESLRAWFAERGEKPMRIRQVRQWLFQQRAESFAGMTDLPQKLREQLDAEFTIFGSVIDRHMIATDGTQKLVLRWQDGRRIECVMIPEGERRTACISTQVGCAMGCVFCASGLNGVERNLTRGEILEELIRIRNVTAPGERLTNVVVMGMGEPMANLDNLLAALDTAGRKDGLDLGARHVTISTVGLPVKMRRLAEHGKAYHLAVSLHAPNDELRSQIVPTNQHTGIEPILAAADAYFEQTGRQVTYEYVVLGGINDQPIHATQLANLLRGRKAYVNLIPFNAVEGLPYRDPKPRDLRHLIDTLRSAGVAVNIRKRKGADIDAACGQLRRKVEAEAQANAAQATADARAALATN
ncbi:50s rrna methyltransferase : Probable dual-specificity RNA methyltransferase RlmN OS=Singulisphaera acidiphila (strain ATCC BAA-1392 / DSM 18658 / VKM B-2454 / MOB10) GN=rlmN PE=3 SV=1: Radical_SAM [Tuwongella immobilis]|uniref:Probable dual-specificity RNA methyltransferase RlmN n=1 Tax=Tuwongella immobilis TaxID=692036 RepID=A0A6C2YU94_9BACT|nr:23S rRNA (adenine(2503)-C(2))-methyltransferase RlmN [Tuwongella immobilis]VIP05004.1 50s rrna methyltransferase : Probable dual-specificity RNA methyltransferase RlmN OS=Singulisphaera acidiphila (strain ATCC BAA-1392 / DSM 18658 / VKM B-2454 / MOB10) GN=rlmN PE=3 SV=1: Radical_SAM [Tuwongella immobilis]VTS07366.1 50s rrna methyltransferase : Probable dual-specificity RNA methyltransferase RlmN OS=Singulisphaera acidiphila (strain ATCC BAA-1392 / DSM 18658 / VKM B-2454 / MOB10) GN=rlmN PE=3 S